MYECLMRTLKPLVLPMSNPDVDLGKVTSHNVTCNQCQNNMAEIFQESGEFCLHCWQERTYPNI
jgi:hypothetical protein